MTAPMPPALDYLIGQLETTAERCQGGDGSNNALRKNGRGEGLRIAASLLREKWPAIRAEVLSGPTARLAAVEDLLGDLEEGSPLEKIGLLGERGEGRRQLRIAISRRLRRDLGLPPREDR